MGRGQHNLIQTFRRRKRNRQNAVDDVVAAPLRNLWVSACAYPASCYRVWPYRHCHQRRTAEDDNGGGFDCRLEWGASSCRNRHFEHLGGKRGREGRSGDERGGERERWGEERRKGWERWGEEEGREGSGDKERDNIV